MSLLGKEPTPTTGTKGHVQLHRVLSDIGFLVEDEFSVGQYSLDCYVDEVHLGFEFDGADFHASVVQRKRDEARDLEILTEWGIPLFRVISEDLLVGNRAVLEAGIKDFVEEHTDTLAERRKLWLHR